MSMAIVRITGKPIELELFSQLRQITKWQQSQDMFAALLSIYFKGRYYSKLKVAILRRQHIVVNMILEVKYHDKVGYLLHCCEKQI